MDKHAKPDAIFLEQQVKRYQTKIGRLSLPLQLPAIKKMIEEEQVELTELMNELASQGHDDPHNDGAYQASDVIIAAMMIVKHDIKCKIIRAPYQQANDEETAQGSSHRERQYIWESEDDIKNEDMYEYGGKIIEVEGNGEILEA